MVYLIAYDAFDMSDFSFLPFHPKDSVYEARHIDTFEVRVRGTPIHMVVYGDQFRYFDSPNLPREGVIRSIQYDVATDVNLYITGMLLDVPDFRQVARTETIADDRSLIGAIFSGD